jgi:hypothetical protein
MKRLLSILAILLCAAPAFSQTLTFTLETTNPDGKSLGAASHLDDGARGRKLRGIRRLVGHEARCGHGDPRGRHELEVVHAALHLARDRKPQPMSWDAPTTNTDGTPLTDLASFKIIYGTAATALTQTGTAPASALTWQSPQLAVGNWFFAVRAVNQPGIESDNSNVAQKVITADATQSRTQTLGFLVPSRAKQREVGPWTTTPASRWSASS